MEPGRGGVSVNGRATIDTRPPFRSVKEAVALFGERVLVGEIYGKQLKEMEPKVNLDIGSTVTSTLGVVSIELEETKQRLQKEREEGNYIATCLKSLKEELEQTKRELMHLKSSKNVSIKRPKTINPEIEELEFVPNLISNQEFDNNYENGHLHEQQNKRSVTFASPPSLTREMVRNNMPDDGSSARLGRTPSFRNEAKGAKKKPLFSLVGWFLPKKKKNYADDYDRSPII